MLFFAKKLIASLLLPPVGLVLLALLGVALMRRRPRGGAFLATTSLLALLVLSLPVVGHGLLVELEQSPPIADAGRDGVQAIVVLGGGNYHQAPEYGADTVSRTTLVRVRYGAKLHRETGKPLLVTGGAPFGGLPEGEAMRAVLEQEFKVPVQWVESVSRDTAENASMSAPMLKAAGISRVALVTHAWHMPRAKWLFEQQGITVEAAPTAYSTEPPDPLARWLPSAHALEKSSRAMTEFLGLFIYRLAK